MAELWQSHGREGYEPDFVERNGAWLISVLGLSMTCVTATLVYFLKSRCTSIKCCGFECERDVLNLERVPEESMQIGEVSRIAAISNH